MEKKLRTEEEKLKQVNETKMESKVKEMPKLCINNIEWEHLEKKYAFFASSGERIYDDVNENNIESIFNILQEWDKDNEEIFQQREFFQYYQCRAHYKFPP